MVNLTPKFVTDGTFHADFTTNQNHLSGNMGIVNATSNNYNDLANKPKINDVELIGNKTSQELNIVEDKNFVYMQNVSSTIWEIKHGLNKYPSVTVVDSADNVVVGDIVYIDENNVRITFTAGFSGKAYFN